MSGSLVLPLPEEECSPFSLFFHSCGRVSLLSSCQNLHLESFDSQVATPTFLFLNFLNFSCWGRKLIQIKLFFSGCHGVDRHRVKETILFFGLWKVLIETSTWNLTPRTIILLLPSSSSSSYFLPIPSWKREKEVNVIKVLPQVKNLFFALCHCHYHLHLDIQENHSHTTSYSCIIIDLNRESYIESKQDEANRFLFNLFWIGIKSILLLPLLLYCGNCRWQVQLQASFYRKVRKSPRVLSCLIHNVTYKE